MIFWILLVGLATAIIAAIPPGAANYMVIKERINHNTNTLHKLILGASLGEVFIAAFALQYAMSLTHFFQENKWFQVSIAAILLSLGVWLLLKPKKETSKNSKKYPKVTISKTLKGFLLAAINPPVLVYWVIVFSALGMYVNDQVEQSSLEMITLYFTGIFLGKISVLYGYSYWGRKLSNKGNANGIISRVLGIALVIVGSFQGFRLFIQ